MKICWDELEHLILMPGTKVDDPPKLIYYNDIENRIGWKGEFAESDEPCIYCNEPFLTKKNSKIKYCSKQCKAEHTPVVNKGPDKRLKENGGGWQTRGKGPWNKDTTIPEKCVTYDHYSIILGWCVEIRRDTEDIRVLQTKCCICGKWFRPSVHRVRMIADFAEGKNNKTSWGFYCSKRCTEKCRYYGKNIDAIILEDYLRSGKAKYSELYPTPHSILYYDWQEDLKKQQCVLQKSYKRKKLRRRKKRETEKRRAAEKRKKITDYKKYLKSEDRKKELKLKKLLYAAKQRAITKNWEYDLDFEWMLKNTPEYCPKCKIKLNFGMERNMNPWAPSIDRKDPNKGYTKNNCLITCWMYNCGKNAYNEEILYKICRAYLKNNMTTIQQT